MVKPEVGKTFVLTASQFVECLAVNETPDDCSYD